MTRPCEVLDLALVTYENGILMQETFVSMRQKDLIPDQLLLLEHPPVITLGRGGDPAHLLVTAEKLHEKRIQFHDTTRGGEITYHGPGQLVGYPILHLGEGNRDVRKYVTKLEEVLILTLADLGIIAARVEGQRGVWVGRDKIAAIGVRIARWVTSHGFALNVENQLENFSLITPCGLHGTGVTSIETLTGRKISREQVAERLKVHFAEVFARALIPRGPELELVKVVVHDGDRVLLLHRKKKAGDFWQPITGKIRRGETPQKAAMRELREETGEVDEVHDLDLHQSFLIDTPWNDTGRPILTSERAFSATRSSFFPVSIDRKEHDDYGWFSFDDAYGRIQWSDDREAIERVEACMSSRAG